MPATLTAPPLMARQLPSLAQPVTKTYELTKTGVVFRRALTAEEHDALGRRLAVVANATPWQFGDWLVAATQHYDGIEAGVRRVLELTGRSLETARIWLKVSLTYVHDERDLAPWTFYREALRLPSRDRLMVLAAAQQNHWTRSDFVAFINRRLRLGQDDDDLPLGATSAALDPRRGVPRRGRQPGPQHAKCPSCGKTFEIRGHTVKVPAKASA